MARRSPAAKLATNAGIWPSCSIKGELVILEGAADASVAAERHFLHALYCAQRQGALSWELRSAISLALLMGNQRRVVEGRELLGSVFGRFTEGFETADLQDAKSLLKQLR